MGRISRNKILYDECLTHKTWHAHNNENSLQTNLDKHEYLDLLFKKISVSACSLYAYSIMSNHAHELYKVKNVKNFSCFMRIHHGIFGRLYNRRNSRKGKVANERPTTTLVRSQAHEVIALLYIHANIFETSHPNPEEFEWSTHRLYAYGERNIYNSKIVFPDWYIQCGSSDFERQKYYRNLFQSYLTDPTSTVAYIHETFK